MDLVGRVRRGLGEQSVHPTEFEQCACALLQRVYPGLSAVEGGHDFGRDADIYFPLGGGDAGGRGRLMVTTGDPAANLRAGLRSMVENGIRVDLIVIACTAPVSATVRASLDSICENRGFAHPHVYARDWLVGQLVREAHWRQRLLGIKGELGALLDRPLEALERAVPAPILVGRDAELASLEAAVLAGRDVLVTGVPGVGKTRLATETSRRVMFLESAGLERLVDELLMERPEAVVVDDAHLRSAELRALRHARQQEGIAFPIIATCWPDSAPDVREMLPTATEVSIGLLERREMDELVKSVGVTGYRARVQVLRQAQGRPGWALALCELFVKGRGYDVVSGAALVANAERYLRRATESETALDALAFVAALGMVSSETLVDVAPLIGVAPAALSRLMERLAHNGLVEFANGGWRLQPALRSPLVARWFFTDPPGRPWSTICEAFPDRSLDLADSAVAAAATGSPAARRWADAWARSLPEPSRWDDAVLAVAADYSTLDERAADFAVRGALTLLSSPRQTHQIRGITLDLTAERATQVLARAARRWILPAAVFGLLDLATNDLRPRAQTPQHPLRVLSEMAGNYDPDFGTQFEVRERLLECALDWLSTNRDVRGWEVAAELIAAIFTIEASGHWGDPGDPNTITILQGVENAEILERLLTLWRKVESTLRTEREATTPGCPPAALARLIDLANTWLRLGMGLSPGRTAPEDAQRRVGARGGHAMLESLRPAVQAVPGLALRAQRLLDDLRERSGEPDSLPAGFEIDTDLRDLVGGYRHYRSEDGEAAWRARAAAVQALAMRLTLMGPGPGTARFEELIGQAKLVTLGTEERWVAECMQPHMDDPAAWYAAAAKASSPLLLGAALANWLQNAPSTVPADTLTAALQDQSFRAAIVSVIVERTELDETAEIVIANLRAEDTPSLSRLTARTDVDEVLHRLLTHPIAAICGVTALSFAVAQPFGPPLPEQWSPEWRDAVAHLRAQDVGHHSEWRMRELLDHLAEHDPDLFERWFAERLDEQREQGYLSTPEPYGCEHNLARLPRSHRHRLAARCTNRSRIGQSLLTYLLGRDRDLAEQLLDNGSVTCDHLLEALAGQRNAILEHLGPLLLERGVPPERIAAFAGEPFGTVRGEDSARHLSTIAYFADLAERIPVMLPVAEAGQTQQRALYEHTVAEERRDRTR
ncbi:MAG TPA: hypothetical protein VFU65_00670 [Actinocrinis sp.]|nr:hypothetical protein [Actinocrinis sp.]